MEPGTQKYIRTKFAEYYSRAKFEFPPDATKREWAFMFFEGGMYRHKAFPIGEDAANFIKTNVPLHVYYSSAYYEKPDEEMRRKGWLGADLIFDLDADHLPKRETSYEKMLEAVKKETLKLLDFLVSDFALEDLEVVFSGGRGYHIHARDEHVRKLKSQGRREVLDYIIGPRPDDINNFIIKERVESETTYHKSSAIRLDNKSGWGYRLNKELVNFLSRLAIMNGEEAVDKVRELTGMSVSNAKKLVRISKDSNAMDSISKGVIDQIGIRGAETLWQGLIREAGVKVLEARPDEPVTHDINRLIRLPTSLHGGSSFRVVPLKIEELEAFDPLRDAVVFGDAPIKLRAKKKGEIKIKGETFKFEEGEVTLPEYAAMFLVCRGIAEIGVDPNLDASHRE